jgi:hypothetical protein
MPPTSWPTPAIPAKSLWSRKTRSASPIRLGATGPGLVRKEKLHRAPTQGVIRALKHLRPAERQEALTSTRTLPEISAFAAIANASAMSSNGST